MHRIFAASALALMLLAGCQQASAPGTAAAPATGTTPAADVNLVTLKLPGMT